MFIYHKGFNYSQDGPGNRLVYHMQGCNMLCIWCSNPESMPRSSPGAVWCETEEIVREALSCEPVFFDGGGVTFTGGEPTVQYEALLDALKALNAAGIGTCIENNGTHPRLEELSEYVGFMITDFKHPDPERHKFYTGTDNARITDNLRRLSYSRRQLHIRIPLVHGVNVLPEDFIAFFDTLDMTGVTVEVLRYHEFGKDKWKSGYKITDGFVSDEEYAGFVGALKAAGIKLVDY